jgi:hypothetical protein
LWVGVSTQKTEVKIKIRKLGTGHRAISDGLQIFFPRCVLIEQGWKCYERGKDYLSAFIYVRIYGNEDLDNLDLLPYHGN